MSGGSVEIAGVLRENGSGERIGVISFSLNSFGSSN